MLLLLFMEKGYCSGLALISTVRILSEPYRPTKAAVRLIEMFSFKEFIGKEAKRNCQCQIRHLPSRQVYHVDYKRHPPQMFRKTGCLTPDVTRLFEEKKKLLNDLMKRRTEVAFISFSLFFVFTPHCFQSEALCLIGFPLFLFTAQNLTNKPKVFKRYINIFSFHF